MEIVAPLMGALDGASMIVPFCFASFGFVTRTSAAASLPASMPPSLLLGPGVSELELLLHATAATPKTVTDERKNAVKSFRAGIRRRISRSICEPRWPALPENGGFARLVREGTWVKTMRCPHAVTDTELRRHPSVRRQAMHRFTARDILASLRSRPTSAKTP
jgi:hypothetical protein